MPSSAMRERLQFLKRQIEADTARKERKRAEEAEQRRVAFERHRAEQIAAAEELKAQKSANSMVGAR